MSPRAWCTHSPAPPLTKPISTRWRPCCTAARRRSSPMPAMPGQVRAGARRPRCLLEHRDQAQPHQSVAQSPAAVGGADGAGSGQLRAWVEHPFHVVKNLFRHKKLRYRGIAKNTAQLHTLFALANLVIVKKTLLAQFGHL